MSNFDSKIFNPEVFGKYVERIPNLKRNELLRSGALKNRNDIKSMFSAQTGGNYATIPMKGLLEGAPLNYDGVTDITAEKTTTFSQSVVVTGRAKAWVEADFSEDITGGVDFMDNVASQVASYWDDVDQATLLSILKGIFSMTGAANLKFVNGHTYDVTTIGTGNCEASTLNTAIQRACGDNKGTFSMVIMHSAVSTNLENLNLIERLKYTDANGIQRELAVGTWNGRIVLIDDGMPYEEKEGYIEYTTYVLGNGAIDYVDCGAKVPYEMDRDPKVNGGEDTLYSRQRKVFAPKGISFTKKSMATASPTDAELEMGANWELVKDATGTKTIDHKAIPIARIVSKG